MSALTSHAAPATECVCIQAIRVNPDCISEKSKNYYGMYGFGTYVAFNIPNGYPEMPFAPCRGAVIRKFLVAVGYITFKNHQTNKTKTFEEEKAWKAKKY